MIPLYGHTSIENAYMVNDYPYGRDRCRIRFWLERDEKRGFRFCSQTEHPRKLIWNAPKKSTYSLLAGCMYLDDKGHVVWTGLTEYSSAEDVKKYLIECPGSDLSNLLPWCMQKARFSEGRAEGKIKWTINKVVQTDTEEEIEGHVREAEMWKECVSILTLAKKTS